jgi:hypothetical protein
MSKSVRLKEHLYAEVERLAKEERRSLANMVEILLEQALRVDAEPITREEVQTEPFYVQTQTTTTRQADRRRESPSRNDEVRTDFK